MAVDRIVLLDDNTANRIAAGEVVERPASAVKELVENAIDAGATQIAISLEEGGKDRLVIVDNGCGMTQYDAILAFQRHATSKIRSAEDLFAIQTLGFRGEALPSIASVSHVTLTTKPADSDSGTQIVIRGGEIISVEEVAARDGTSLDVENLFFNTPARMKFLKSTPTEVARTVDAVAHLASAYPRIAFRLRNGSQEIFSTPGTDEPLAALASVWGRDVAKKLIPIHNDQGGIGVSGFIATPDATRPGRSHELFFINRRPIKSRLLGHALEEAFRSLTPDARYPIGAIFVQIDPSLVDVNVHPTKTEVKFTRDGEVHHAVSQAIKLALLAYGIVPTPRLVTPILSNDDQQSRMNFPLPSISTNAFSTPLTNNTLTNYNGLHNQSTISNQLCAGAFIPTDLPGQFEVQKNISDAEPADIGQFGLPQPDDILKVKSEEIDRKIVTENEGLDPLTTRRLPKPFAEQLREFRVLGQARNTYIIAMTPDGIAVVDQHVAHERVLYERLTLKRFSNGIPVQRLVVPSTISLGRREALLLAENCDAFTAVGWELSPFGKDSFALRSVPAMLAHKPYEQILRDMIDELVNQTVSRRLLVQQEHVTITNACKMAVKAGDPLNIEEMQGLLEQLAETENPYLCPHGRPIVVTVSFHELDKQFKRA